MSREYHATSLVEDDIVRVSGDIIEKLEKGSIGICSSRILLLADPADTNDGFVINNLSVV